MSQVVLTQHVTAPPEQVYAAFTSAEALARWWWPHIADTTYAVDARVGGAYDVRSQAAGIGARGEFLELDAASLIRITWNWMNDGVSQVEEEVHIAFSPDGDGTLLTLTHHLAPQAGDGEDLRQGWSDVLARLAEIHR
ncbi:MAG: SRPBCC domain-containing protein [Anaerolineales bacterium]|nr:SRPBCC domain-containing protein [Anaerolineales bacterium]